MMGLPEKNTCTVLEAAHALGVSKRTVYKLVEEGRLLTINIGTSADLTQRRWRVVVRRDEAVLPRAHRQLYLSLSELMFESSNQHENAL